jgi:putative flippase GtrA
VLSDPRLRKIAGEFLRFAIIGAAATVVHYSILVALVELAHAPVIASTSIGFAVGSAFSYTLNRRLTFGHQPQFGSGLVRYLATGGLGLCLNGLLVAGLMRAGLPYLLAQMAATGVVLIWNFVFAKLFVFQSPKAD